MSNDTAQQTLLQELERFFRRCRPGGYLAPIDGRDEWKKLVKSQTPEEQELLNELARFADLWRYLRQRDEKLGPSWGSHFAAFLCNNLLRVAWEANSAASEETPVG